MRRTRPFRNGIATFVALCLLLAQLATSAYACPQWRGQPTALSAALAGSAEPAAAVRTAMPPMPGCDMASAAPMDPAQPGLCKAHCQGGQADQQSHDPKAGADLHSPLLAVLWTLAWVLQAVPGPESAKPLAGLAAGPPPGSPPLYLIHQVFRL